MKKEEKNIDTKLSEKNPSKIKHHINKIKNIKLSPAKLILFLVVFGLILFSYYLTSTFNYEQNISLDKTITIPFTSFELDLKESSLFLSAAIIGIVDGFNPCAMWVLIYLITLVASLNDRKKMFLIVGIFLTTGTIMYFAILAGWLHLFNFLGFSKWILYAVGGFALWFGIYSIYDFIRKGGQITCDIGDIDSRKKTMLKIKTIAKSPITIASIFGTILLAIAVNSIEFVCSAGLPAIFTQMLAVADVSMFSKYMYILVYVFFFMLDDLIIFSLALFAVNSPLLDKYSGLSKLVGGIIMLLIGIMLLFFPNLLM